QGNVDSFLLRSGPADAPALFDFHHLRIAFEPVWQELFDTDTVHTAHEIYSKFAQIGIDPNSYLNGPLASMLHIGSSIGVIMSILQDAKTSGGATIHHWVTQAFEITQEEWDALQLSEQRDLVILAARVVGAGNDLAAKDEDTKPFNVPEPIQPEF